jgi:hypothetical protein
MSSAKLNGINIDFPTYRIVEMQITYSKAVSGSGKLTKV